MHCTKHNSTVIPLNNYLWYVQLGKPFNLGNIQKVLWLLIHFEDLEEFVYLAKYIYFNIPVTCTHWAGSSV